MIDIHSHILPNVDDGSDSLETTRALLNLYVEQGVSRVVCTSHQNRDCIRTEDIKQVFAALQSAVKDIPVELCLGAEIYYYAEMLRDLENGKLLTLNGTRCVLVEFSVTEPTDIADIVYDLSIAGYTPIVAHIERYTYLTKDDYFLIKESGGLIQVNSGSILFKGYLKILKFLFKNDLVDFVASDCHDLAYRSVDFVPVKNFIRKKYPNLFNKLFGEKI